MSKKPKRFKGIKTFNNYKELCAFLEIEPSPRGKAKEKQLNELKEFYDIDRRKSGRFKINYITQKERKLRKAIKL